MRKERRLIVKRRIKAPGLELIELAHLTVRRVNTSQPILSGSQMDGSYSGKAISNSTPTKMEVKSHGPTKG